MHLCWCVHVFFRDWDRAAAGSVLTPSTPSRVITFLTPLRGLRTCLLFVNGRDTVSNCCRVRYALADRYPLCSRLSPVLTSCPVRLFAPRMYSVASQLSPPFSGHPVSILRGGWCSHLSPLEPEIESPPFLVPGPEHSVWQPATIRYSFPFPGVLGELG